MGAEGVAQGNTRVIEIVGQVVGHTQATHDRPGADVVDGSKGDHLLQIDLGEAEVERRRGRLSRVPVPQAHRASRQPISTAGRKAAWKPGIDSPVNPTKRPSGRSSSAQNPKPFRSNPALIESTSASLSRRVRVEEKNLHHFGIGVHLGEGVPVGRLPARRTSRSVTSWVVVTVPTLPWPGETSGPPEPGRRRSLSPDPGGYRRVPRVGAEAAAMQVTTSQTMSFVETQTGTGGQGRTAHDDPVVDIAIPVYNEERVLASSVRRLRRYLDENLPWPAIVTIVDNARLTALRMWPRCWRASSPVCGGCAST